MQLLYNNCIVIYFISFPWWLSFVDGWLQGAARELENRAVRTEFPGLQNRGFLAGKEEIGEIGQLIGTAERDGQWQMTHEVQKITTGGGTCLNFADNGRKQTQTPLDGETEPGWR